MLSMVWALTFELVGPWLRLHCDVLYMLYLCCCLRHRSQLPGLPVQMLFCVKTRFKTTKLKTPLTICPASQEQSKHPAHQTKEPNNKNINLHKTVLCSAAAVGWVAF